MLEKSKQEKDKLKEGETKITTLSSENKSLADRNRELNQMKDRLESKI